MHDEATLNGLAVEVGRLDERVSNLESWQEKQNGSIHRVEKKLDKLIFWIMTAAAGGFVSFVTAVILFLLKGV